MATRRSPAEKSKPAKPGRGGYRPGSGRKRLSLEALAARKSESARLRAAIRNGEFALKPDPEPAAPRDYSAIAEQYAQDVVAGKIPACKWTRLSCSRHLRDLQRQSAEGFPYHFDCEVANRFCAQIEKYPHIKGRWAQAQQFIHLEPWQCFNLAVPFGWLRENGKRRFRTMFLLVARKNAKSTKAAAIGNNMLTIDGEFGAEVYCGATSEKQAWEVFGPARLMFERSKKLCKEFGIEVMARSIFRAADNSSFRPLIGKPGDGASPSCSIHDEYHEQQDSSQLDAMETGMGSREQPMVVIISTAGVDLGSPCYEEQKVAEQVLEGVLDDDTLFANIYTIDMPDPNGKTEAERKGDDWADPAVLVKANPNIGISVDPEWLIAQQRDAVLHPAHQNRFKTKHLNVWCSASVAGINMHSWKLCADPDLRVEEFEGKPCFGSLDLASKVDLCAWAKVFVKMINGQRHYYAFVRHFLPEKAVEEGGPNRKNYEKWSHLGRLVLTPGSETDFDMVREEVKGDSLRHQVEEICYDPWRATQLAHQLSKDGAKVIEVGQTTKNMGEAFDELLTAIKAGRFHHDGCPVLEWEASNVIAKETIKGLRIPSKERREAKIDGIVALVMAIMRAMVAEPGDAVVDWLRDPVVA